MLYKSEDLIAAFNDQASDIPEDLWRGTEIEGYFDLNAGPSKRETSANKDKAGD